MTIWGDLLIQMLRAASEGPIGADSAAQWTDFDKSQLPQNYREGAFIQQWLVCV